MRRRGRLSKIRAVKEAYHTEEDPKIRILPGTIKSWLKEEKQ